MKCVLLDLADKHLLSSSHLVRALHLLAMQRKRQLGNVIISKDIAAGIAMEYYSTERGLSDASP
jgi:hypothetical protein